MKIDDTVLSALLEVRSKYETHVDTDMTGITLMIECRRPAYRVIQHLDYHELPKDAERREKCITFVMKQMILKLDDMVAQSFMEKR